MRPLPFSQVTLFFLNRNSTPLTLAVTTSPLRACIRARSSFTPSTTMPWSAKAWPAAWKFSDDCSSALDGMQPILRQVPPSVARFSTQATLHAELRRADGADIAARAGADDDDVETVAHRASEPEQQAARVLDAFLDAHQERDRLLAVDDAVVVAKPPDTSSAGSRPCRRSPSGGPGSCACRGCADCGGLRIGVDISEP